MSLGSLLGWIHRCTGIASEKGDLRRYAGAAGEEQENVKNGQ